MEFQKIKLTKQRTLEVTYKNADGDVINFVGANIVHKDLRQAMQALVPHLAVITEQREAFNRTLKAIKKDRITDEGNDSVYKRLDVDGLSFSNGEREVAVSGQRILTTAGVVALQTPRIDMEDSDAYQYAGDLALDVDAVKYEARQYVEERKWGLKEGEIAFEDINPFDGVQASEVPIVEAQQPADGQGQKTKKKGGRKQKAA